MRFAVFFLLVLLTAPLSAPGGRGSAGAWTAFRTAPVARQTNPRSRLARTAFSLTPPPSPEAPLFLSPFRLVLSGCRFCEGQNKPNNIATQMTTHECA